MWWLNSFAPKYLSNSPDLHNIWTGIRNSYEKCYTLPTENPMLDFHAFKMLSDAFHEASLNMCKWLVLNEESSNSKIFFFSHKIDFVQLAECIWAENARKARSWLMYTPYLEKKESKRELKRTKNKNNKWECWTCDMCNRLL